MLKNNVKETQVSYIKRTIYVRPRDVDIWDRVITFCKGHDVSLSQFVADAMRNYMDQLTTN